MTIEPMTNATGRKLACASCGEPFRCGIDEPGGCWCARLPALPATARVPDADCLCERCLRAALAHAGKTWSGGTKNNTGE